MTKKHFQAFANTLRTDMEETARRWPTKLEETRRAVTYAAYAFTRVAQDDNPRFDRERFYKACGL